MRVCVHLRACVRVSAYVHVLGRSCVRAYVHVCVCLLRLCVYVVVYMCVCSVYLDNNKSSILVFTFAKRNCVLVGPVCPVSPVEVTLATFSRRSR